MALDTIGGDNQSFAVQSATIANAAALSSAVPSGMHLVGIQMPAAWTAAAITFLGSADNLTFQPVFDANGAEVMVQATAGTYHAIPPITLPKVPYLQVRSGTNAVPVNQGAARTIQLVFARYQ